jgi:hypothetical protein
MYDRALVLKSVPSTVAMNTASKTSIAKVTLLTAGAVLTAYLFVQPTPYVRDVFIPVPLRVLEKINGETFSLQSIAGTPYLLYVWDFG